MDRKIADPAAPVLVTGAGGFVGSRVVSSLLRMGFKNVRCLVRPSTEARLLEDSFKEHPGARCEIVKGNLLSVQDCRTAAKGVHVVYHLVAGRGKSFPGCYQNSVVTTRNLLDAVLADGNLKCFVNVSSLGVYSNWTNKRGAVMDETCPVEDNLPKRHDSYVYGKIKQDELVVSYHKKHNLPYTIVRPGIVFGPGKKFIPAHVGIDTFGIFMHLGGNNRVPLTYVDNCADAIVLSGIVEAAKGEVFNIIDDGVPRSREFLRAYKTKVRRIRSVPIPYRLAYALCSLWENYAESSRGQLPPVFNRRSCAFAWKGNRYNNRKAKELLGWQCRVPMDVALEKYFGFQRND